MPKLGRGKPGFRRACPSWAEANQVSGSLAQAGQRQTEFQAGLPKLGRGKLSFRRACPSWAEANQVSGELAQAGQRQTKFQASLPNLGRGKLSFRRACPIWAEENQVSGGLAQAGQRQTKFGYIQGFTQSETLNIADKFCYWYLNKPGFCIAYPNLHFHTHENREDLRERRTFCSDYQAQDLNFAGTFYTLKVKRSSGL